MIPFFLPVPEGPAIERFRDNFGNKYRRFHLFACVSH